MGTKWTNKRATRNRVINERAQWEIIILWIALVVWTYSKREHRNRLKVRYNKLIKDLKRE